MKIQHKDHDKHLENLKEWYPVAKEKMQNLPIKKGDFVLDFGAYKGQWAKDAVARFGCKIKSFEPIEEFAKEIKHKDIEVVKKAVAGENKKQIIHLNKDGTSFYSDGKSVEIEVIDVSDVFSKYQQIDFVKINIEGAEFDFFESLIRTKQLTKAKSYLIQFHPLVGYEARLKNIYEEFSKSGFKKTWGYDLIWELWEKA